MQRTRRKIEIPWIALAALALAAAPLAADPEPIGIGVPVSPAPDPEPPDGCGDEDREEFLALAEGGATYEELEDLYGHCNDGAQLVATTAGQNAGQKVFQMLRTGSTFFEEMNSCGYNPQSKVVACDVELKRRTGYGPFPTGSRQFIRYCFACNTTSLNPNSFNHTFLGSVHVTNNISSGTPSYFFTASSRSWFDPPTTSCQNNDGQAMTVRAILSFGAPVPTCFSRPIFGNQITFTARRDP